MNKLIIFSFLILQSCYKEDHRNETIECILEAKLWQPIRIEVTGPFPSKKNIENCESDDYWRFKSHGRLEIYSGKTKCYSGEPDVDIESWSLIETQFENIIHNNLFIGGVVYYSIDSIDFNHLVISYANDPSYGFTSITYKGFDIMKHRSF